MKDLKFRFEELITAVDLLPDNVQEQEEVAILPYLTRDMAEPELFTALMVQSMKGDMEFRGKMVSALTGSAIASVSHNETVSDDDFSALALAVNICWASGAGHSLFQIMGLIGSMAVKFDVELPEAAFLVLRPQDSAIKLSDFDPHKIINHEYTPESIIEDVLTKALDEDDLEQVREFLRDKLSGEQE